MKSTASPRCPTPETVGDEFFEIRVGTNNPANSGHKPAAVIELPLNPSTEDPRQDVVNYRVIGNEERFLFLNPSQ